MIYLLRQIIKGTHVNQELKYFLYADRGPELNKSE